MHVVGDPPFQVLVLGSLPCELALRLCNVSGIPLTELLGQATIAKIVDRTTDPRYPEPSGYGPAIPWPAF